MLVMPFANVDMFYLHTSIWSFNLRNQTANIYVAIKSTHPLPSTNLPFQCRSSSGCYLASPLCDSYSKGCQHSSEPKLISQPPIELGEREREPGSN